MKDSQNVGPVNEVTRGSVMLDAAWQVSKGGIKAMRCPEKKYEKHKN
ncbi:MAG: hypothetical protein U9Q34_04840 [Elusimicrobiota bacterium]|nr:hypothetical protein [Elusimicrobiota bacterium]